MIKFLMIALEILIKAKELLLVLKGNCLNYLIVVNALSPSVKKDTVNATGKICSAILSANA